MKANQIKVLYVSRWEEGNVESDAALDLNTGMVTDIEDGKGGDDLEYHIGDVVLIASDKLGALEAIVGADANGDYRVINVTELETFRSAAKFEVLTEEFSGFINTYTHDDAPLYFQTLEAAREDLQEHLKDTIVAASNGDLSGDYQPSEFLVRDVTTDEMLNVDWNWNRENLVFTGSNIIQGFDDDHPTVCPKCGSCTEFDDMPDGLQRHTCMSCDTVFFAGEMGELFSNQDDRTDKNGAEDIKKIATAISAKLNKLGFRNKGKAIKHTQLLEVAAVALGYRNKHIADVDVKKLASSHQNGKTEPMPPNRARLIIEVDYNLDGESIEDMAANLRGMADYAIQNGMLTGATCAEVDCYEVDVITSGNTSAHASGKMEYAVIGYYDDNGQIFCHHVESRDAFNAFAIVAAKADGDGTLPQFIAALPVSDTKRLEYPGEGVVSFETVLEQDDVFPL